MQRAQPRMLPSACRGSHTTPDGRSERCPACCPPNHVQPLPLVCEAAWRHAVCALRRRGGPLRHGLRWRVQLQLCRGALPRHAEQRQQLREHAICLTQPGAQAGHCRLPFHIPLPTSTSPTPPAGYQVLSVTAAGTLPAADCALGPQLAFASPPLFGRCSLAPPGTTLLSLYVDQYCGAVLTPMSDPQCAEPGASYWPSMRIAAHFVTPTLIATRFNPAATSPTRCGLRCLPARDLTRLPCARASPAKQALVGCLMRALSRHAAPTCCP